MFLSNCSCLMSNVHYPLSSSIKFGCVSSSRFHPFSSKKGHCFPNILIHCFANMRISQKKRTKHFIFLSQRQFRWKVGNRLCKKAHVNTNSLKKYHTTNMSEDSQRNFHLLTYFGVFHSIYDAVNYFNYQLTSTHQLSLTEQHQIKNKNERKIMHKHQNDILNAEIYENQIFSFFYPSFYHSELMIFVVFQPFTKPNGEQNKRKKNYKIHQIIFKRWEKRLTVYSCRGKLNAWQWRFMQIPMIWEKCWKNG